MALTDQSAQAAYNSGVSHYKRRTPDDLEKAYELFKHAVEIEPDNPTAYAALAKLQIRALYAMFEHSHKLGIGWYDGTPRTWQYLQKANAEPNVDYFITLSMLALKRRQPERAIAEARMALTLCPNHVEAMNVLAEALIYAGRVEEGLSQVQRAIQLGQEQKAQSHFVIGLARFAQGHLEESARSIELAKSLAPTETSYAGLVASVYGLLGKQAKAAAAFEEFGSGMNNLILHEAVALFPFEQFEVLDRFAEGLKSAGAPVRAAGYLKLHAGTRLSGAEIRSVLFDAKIIGKRFWDGASGFPWSQERTSDGKVVHSGYNVQPGIGSGNVGSGRIDNDVLCETWPHLAPDIELCFSIFRVEGRIARIKWGDYVMVTDTSPQPFSVAE